jgi:hypothetical protein
MNLVRRECHVLGRLPERHLALADKVWAWPSQKAPKKGTTSSREGVPGALRIQHPPSIPLLESWGRESGSGWHTLSLIWVALTLADVKQQEGSTRKNKRHLLICCAINVNAA